MAREKVIFHVDVNSAFLSWEATYRIKVLGESLDLRDIPSAIGGDIEERRGIILAKSIPSKRYDIQTGEPVTSALMKCPELMIVPPNYGLYVKCSNILIELLREYSPFVEQYSIDEAFMDMSGSEGLFGSPLAVANLIRERVYKELGFTVNIGVSSNKLLAKMASDFTKPNRVHTLFPNEIEEKLWPLPVRDLFFVGKASERTLRRLSIKTIGDLAKADVKLIKSHLKKHGEVIHAYANGRDISEVVHRKVPNKGYGNSMTIPYDVDSIAGANLILLSLCETVGTRLRADNVKVGCVSISVVDMNFEYYSHQTTLHSPTNVTDELYECACRLLKESWNQKIPIRQLGVHTTKVDNTNFHQFDLFDMGKHEKYEKLNNAIDKIRNKYGEDAVVRAPFVNSKLEHMAGGISKEKKTGITKPIS